MNLLFCMYNEFKAQHIQHEFRQQSDANAYLDEIRTLENKIEDLNSKYRDIDRKIEKLDQKTDKMHYMMSHISELLTKSQ